MKIVSVENIYKSANFFLWVNGVLSSVSDMYHACDLKISQKQWLWFSFLIIILINWCSLAIWESSLSHNLILCYRLKRNCCFKNCSLFVAISTIRVDGKVDLVTITFLPIDLYIHICIVCFNEDLLSSI